MLKALGRRRFATAPPTKTTNEWSSDVVSKNDTLDTAISFEDDDSTSSDSHQDNDYGLPSIYTTPGFCTGQQHPIRSKPITSVPTWLRNTTEVLSTLRQEAQRINHPCGPPKATKWWGLNSNLTSVDERQEEIIFEEMNDDDDYGNMDTPIASDDTVQSSVSESFSNRKSDTLNFMMQLPFSHRRLGHSMLRKRSEQVEEEICFFPRLEKTKSSADFSNESGRTLRSNSNRTDRQLLGSSPRTSSISMESDPMLPVQRSFQHLTFMSTQDLDALENAPARSTQNQTGATEGTRSSKFFNEATSPTSNSVTSFETKVSLNSTESAMFNVDRDKIIRKKKGLENLRKRLSSAFRSSSGKQCVSYSLSKGKKGMSKQEQAYATSLLPSKPLLSKKERAISSSMVPRPILRHEFDQPLSILLLNPFLKIFEIVLVDFFRDTTVGDVLSKARAASHNESLSIQRYVSLCNRTQELAAPMLPVSLLVDTADPKPDRPLSFAEKRRLMEKRLLVAVPAGSSAKDCQHIRRILWRNPRVQRWWKRSHPFCHPEEESDTEEDVFDTHQLMMDHQFNLEAKAETKSCDTERQVSVRYKRLDDSDEEMV